MIKKFPFLHITIVFAMLVIVKIFLSGLYLKQTPFQISTQNIALAEEQGRPNFPGIGPESSLGSREKELKAKEDRLKKKEAKLLPLQKEVESKMEELNELQTKLTALAKQLAIKEKAMKDAKMAHLVALYSAMEPSKAAAIMSKLQVKSVVKIIGRMKGKSAGKIMAMMDPKKGAIISEALSRPD